MSKGLAIAAATVTLAAALAGCGGDGSGDTASQAAPSGAETESEQPRRNSRGYGSGPGGERAAPSGQESAGAPGKVSAIGNAFAPASVTVEVGDKVTFTNQDGAAHTATADGAFDLKLAPGATREWTAERAGEYSYLCTIHPSMTGTITVQ